MNAAVCEATKYAKDNKCLDCPSGSTCDGTKATACATKKYVKDNKCLACPSGSTCDGAKATACATTKYVKDNKCLACPSGSTCDGKKATVCATTKYVKDNKCLACPSGSTCDGTKAIVNNWKLLFRQTTPTYKSPASKWLSVNPTDPDSPNYSILNTLGDDCKNVQGKFEFKIVWPKRQGNNYNIWHQSTNPVTDEKAPVAGYEPVDVKFTANSFGGLENGKLHSGNPPALLDGTIRKMRVCCLACLKAPNITSSFYTVILKVQEIGSTQSAPE